MSADGDLARFTDAVLTRVEVLKIRGTFGPLQQKAADRALANAKAWRDADIWGHDGPSRKRNRKADRAEIILFAEPVSVPLPMLPDEPYWDWDVTA